MKLESALKYFSPKSQQITDSSRATGGDALTGTDLMGAIGMCQAKSPLGFSAVMAKTGISQEDRFRTIEQLSAYALRTAPKLVTKAAGGKLGHCCVILAKLAFDEYSRSAATAQLCTHCNGQGFSMAKREVMKYPGHVSTLTGEEVIAPRYETELVRQNCEHCKGKGVTSARCRCNGTGRVRDMEASRRQGAPVDKGCERCGGRGYKRMPSSKAYQAVRHLVPELTQSSWSRNWKPYFEKLVTKCEIEESHADAQFRKVTR